MNVLAGSIPAPVATLIEKGVITSWVGLELNYPTVSNLREPAIKFIKPVIFKQQYKMASKYLPKLHLACAADDSLSIPLQYIHIKDDIGYATDGHLAVAVNLKFHSGLQPNVLEKLNGKYVHKNTWKKISDAVELTIENDEIVYVDGSIKAKFQYEDKVKYPDVMSLLQETIEQAPEETSLFGFTPKIMNIVVNVFDNDQIYFIKKKNNFLAYPSVGSYQYALIVPLQISDGGFEFDFNIK